MFKMILKKIYYTIKKKVTKYTIYSHIKRIYYLIIKNRINRKYIIPYIYRYIQYFHLYKPNNRPYFVKIENNKYTIVYPDSDSGEVNIYTRGADYYENKFVRQIIKPGDFIIDAGCNVGNRTLVLSDIISGALLIEPNKKCLERLSTIFKFNNINMSNYYLVPKCVSNKHGFCYFTNYGGTSTQNKITLEPYENSYQVEVTTIDYEMTLIGNPICTYIKFDLEGYDYEGVCGSINTLQNNQVKLIKFELLNSSQLHLFNNFFSKINWIVFSLNQFGKPTLKKNANLKNLNYFACPKKYFSDILT